MNEVESLNGNASFYLNDELLLKFNKDSVDKNLTVVPIDKEGPSYDNWYHGRMSRETSEQLLRKAAKPGSFLIRESERKPRCFVLSYLSLDSNIHHFKIKPIYGVYFIGLRHFDKLETLVSYYMYYSELVEGEKLLNPIEPERITRIESVYMSIKTLDKQNTQHDRILNGHDSSSATTKIIPNNSSVLDIDRIGSYFRVFHEIDNGEWLWAQSLLTNDYGLLKADCVRRIDDDKLHELEPWYYSNISKEDAVSILANAGNSSYLVRPSEQSTGDYTLFFNADNVVHRFRITGCRISEPSASSLLISSSSSPSSSSSSTSSSSSSLSVSPQQVVDQELIIRRYFNIGGRNYTSISCIIDRYMNEDITDGYRLTKLPHKHVCIGDEQSYFANVVYNFNAKTNAEQLESATANLKNYFDMSSSSLNEENSRKFDNQKAGADQQPMSSVIQPQQQQPNVQVDSSKPNGNNKKISKSISSPLSSVTLATQNQQPTSNNGSKQLKGLVSGQHFFLNKTTNDPTSTSSLSSSSTSSSSNSSTQQPAQSNTLNCSLPSSVMATKLANTTSTSATPTGATIKTAAVSNSSTGAPNFIKNSVTNGLKKSLGHSKSAVPSSLKKNQNLDSCLVLKGYLNKYNEKTKKWKLYYFTINQNNQQLFYYSNEKSTKEKGIIDLSRGFYYPVDDSFFNRSFCFQIVIQSYAANLNGNNHSNHNFTNFNVHYLSAENLNSFKEWTENIRPLCNPIQYNPFYGKQANCLLTSSRSSSSLSLSSSSSSSSPLNISLSQTHPPMLMKTAVQQQQQYPPQLPQMNGNNKLTSPPHLPPPTTKTQLSHSCSSSLNYRILRTLSVDVHEARNVCFSPITGGGSLSTSAEPGSFRGQIPCTAVNPSLISQNQNTSLPKYHKDNLYYCSVLFNNRAFVASTRLSTCVNNFHTINFNQSSNGGGGLLSQSMGHTTNGHGLDLDLSSSYSPGCKYASKDAIWDDSFTFDNLPLDVKEMKLCLFVNAKASNFSASFVNNFKKIGSNSGAKMLDPVLIGCVNIRLEDLLNKGLCEAWYNVEPMVHLGNNSNGTPDQTWQKSVADSVEPIGANQSSTGSSTSSSSSSTSSAGEAVAPFRASGCQLRVKIRFCQEKINLNELNYRKLSEYLLNESQHTNLCHLYDQIMPSTERAHFVQSLLKFFIVKNKIINMLKSFLLCEIKRCADLSTLFRPATMCTSLMDHYMRVRCEEFLHVALEQPLKLIFKSDFGSSSASATSSSSTASTSFNSSSTSQQSSSSPDMSFELDPSKCPDKEQRDRNLENFKEALTVLINAICSPTAISLFPNELKYLFFFIRQQVHLKWQKQKPTSDEKSAKIYCVSAFVFLRLICPALLNPKSFNLQFFNPASSGTKSTSTSLDQSRPHRLHHNPNETFTLAHLAAKFSLFSPSFMFTLTPPVHRLSLFKSRSSSTLLTSNYNTHEFQSSNNQINCFNVSSSSQSASSTNGSSSTNGLTSYTNNSTNSWSSSSSSFANQYNLYERNIKLLAKVIQTMANKTECKEPFMMPLSRFLNENKSNLSEFIDSISNMNEFNYHKNDHSLLVTDDGIDCNELSDDSDERDEDLSNYNLRQQFKYATCKYLAIIHRILYSLVPQMKMYLSKLNSSTPSASSDEDRYENGNHDQDQDQDQDQDDDEDNDETKTLNETDVSFAASLTYLISLLEDVHEKTK